MKLGADIHGSHKINPIDFADTLFREMSPELLDGLP